MGDLVGDRELARSDVVANRTMNRERTLSGVNSYARELGLDPSGRLQTHPGGWLDLCSGEGRALHAAADLVPAGTELAGVDLVGPLTPVPARTGARLVTASVADWRPDRTDWALITCVHGLPYLGDKLGLLARWAGWLAPDGLLAVTFDPASIRRPDGRSAARPVLAALRAAGFAYSSTRRLLTLEGGRDLPEEFAGFHYLGADPAAGPNWTGQPAVASVYA
ncbi:class I SAM-dependent methyltransferase [Kitasatospora sp. NPDC059571]|uniref:class I SAM-dependent methyltransferase n=1 Tax=Kitasatospora sp. NPDC059571 TaxID=3346871 RepID=UPI0036768900